LNNPEHSPKILKKQTKTQILPIKGILSLFFLINFNVLGQLASLKQYSLKQGLEKTYNWIYDEIVSGTNVKKFGRK
jgi:hypothetical protein